MDWNANIRVPFVPRFATSENSSFSFLYNYDHMMTFPGMEMNKLQQQASMIQQSTGQQTMLNKAGGGSSGGNYVQDPKKKRLSSEQLESLENSFQEEIKLDPERKMRLAKDLGLQPRQIAVWFQNRRARWKGKQLERLYDALKQEYDAVSRDKQKLQQEVMALRAILKDQLAAKNQASAGYTEVSGGEETVESTSLPSRDKSSNAAVHQIAECSNYMLNMDDYNPMMIIAPPYTWPAPPPCP